MPDSMDSRQALRQRLDDLRSNRAAGALDLALLAVDLALDWIAAGHPRPELSAALRTMHPAIATVANVAGVVEKSQHDPAGCLRAVRQSLAEGNQRIAERLRRWIPAGSSVITLSNSSTVRDVLLSLPAGEVYVLQSQPGGEGAQMAEALRAGMAARPSSASVRLIPDAAMGNAVPRVDCALLGIDSYDRDGAILHKVGTLPLALCCRHFGKPFYAAGHSFKFTDRVLGGLPEPRAALEAQSFDCTPAELITRLVTERDEPG